MKLHHSGYYAWLENPKSKRALENEELLEKIKEFWEESGRVYGYRKIHRDLLDEGYSASLNRIYRIMRAHKIKAKLGKKKKQAKYGTPSKVSENILKQEFNAGQPNEIWVGDTTYIHTHQG